VHTYTHTNDDDNNVRSESEEGIRPVNCSVPPLLEPVPPLLRARHELAMQALAATAVGLELVGQRARALHLLGREDA
jgi:hypothetical protein